MSLFTCDVDALYGSEVEVCHCRIEKLIERLKRTVLHIYVQNFKKGSLELKAKLQEHFRNTLEYLEVQISCTADALNI